MRKAIGQQLAIESPVEADLVVPVPDSGVPEWVPAAPSGGAGMRYRTMVLCQSSTIDGGTGKS